MSGPRSACQRRFGNCHYAALASLLCAAGAVEGCGEQIGGTHRTVENPHYVVVYATTPSPIEVGRHFIVDFAVCSRTGRAAPKAVRVDANMPEHRHGMNYRPGVVVVAPGTYRAEGLLFHMPGRWDLTFDVVTGHSSERLADTLRVE